MTSDGLVEMSEGDFADMGQKNPLMMNRPVRQIRFVGRVFLSCAWVPNVGYDF
jgi:hypothetical protein